MVDSERHEFCASKYTVLLIDDDYDQLFLFEDLLRNKGFKVQAAENAKTALALMSQVHFDIVISDLRMPEMTGFHFIEKVRALKTIPSNAKIPVILLTNCSGDLEEAALKIGADVFCQKREARDKLVAQIKSLLEPDSL